MTSLDDTRDLDAVDAAFHYGGLLVRVVGYAAVWAIAQHYDCGRAILTGVLFGDLLGQALRTIQHWRDATLVLLGEFALLGVVWLLVRGSMAWPDDPAMRAIVGLAGFGVLTGHIGGTMLTRYGPSPA